MVHPSSRHRLQHRCSGQKTFVVMTSHDRRPRSSRDIEKAHDRQGWWSTSVTHTTSHIHTVLSRVSPVITHFSLNTRSSHTHSHRFLGFRNSTPGLLTEFSARLMTLLRVSVTRVPSTDTPPHDHVPHSHTRTGSSVLTTQPQTFCLNFR